MSAIPARQQEDGGAAVRAGAPGSASRPGVCTTAEVRETLPQRDVKRESSSESCPLTSRGVRSHIGVLIFTHTHMQYTELNNYVEKLK